MVEEPIAKAFATFFIVLALALVPLMIITNSIDSMTRSAVESAVQDFSDNARSTRYITREEYDILKSKLAATNYAYRVEMLHRSKVVVPDDGILGYVTAYHAYGYDDIMETLEETGVYEMKNGDFYYIKLTSASDTIGSHIYGIFTGTPGYKLSIPAGGMVGNQR